MAIIFFLSDKWKYKEIKHQGVRYHLRIINLLYNSDLRNTSYRIISITTKSLILKYLFQCNVKG